MRCNFIRSLLGALLLAGGLTAELPAQTKKPAMVTLGNLSQTYNGSPRSATATTNAPGPSSYKLTYDGSPVAPTAVGSYSVVCTLVNDKYEGRGTGILVIAKATATVTLASLSQTYNGSPRPAMASSTAAGNSRFECTYNGSPTAPSAAGKYKVVAKLVNDNYQGSATGTLVIAKATATVTLGNLSQTYDNGLPRPATAKSNATGNSRVTLTYNGSPIAPTAAGSYPVVGTLTNDNYEGRATGTLVVAKAMATVKLGNLSQTYTASPRPATATSTAVGNSRFEFTYNGSPIAPTNPGSYDVAAKLVNDNYQGSATGTLVIAKAPSTTTLTVSPAKPMVGQTITLTATVTATVNGVTPSGKVTLKDGDKAVETVTLANDKGTATATFRIVLPAGSHAFAATYSGDTHFAASTSPVGR